MKSIVNLLVNQYLYYRDRGKVEVASPVDSADDVRPIVHSKYIEDSYCSSIYYMLKQYRSLSCFDVRVDMTRLEDEYGYKLWVRVYQPMSKEKILDISMEIDYNTRLGSAKIDAFLRRIDERVREITNV